MALAQLLWAFFHCRALLVSHNWGCQSWACIHGGGLEYVITAEINLFSFCSAVNYLKLSWGQIELLGSSITSSCAGTSGWRSSICRDQKFPFTYGGETLGKDLWHLCVFAILVSLCVRQEGQCLLPAGGCEIWLISLKYLSKGLLWTLLGQRSMPGTKLCF